ncbi:c-type cytochrome domain-containing protein [Thalassotalea agariperforans]
MVSEELQKRTMSARQYFTVIALLTVVGVASLIWQDAESKQSIKEAVGLAEPLVASPDSFYQQRVANIFDKYCVGCHGDIKAKGHLRMDSFRHTVFGGKSGDMLTGGDHSLLYQRMLLAEENRLAMPPYGRDRQTADEMKVIQMWLAKGASGVLPETEFPDAPSKPKEIKFIAVNKHAIEHEREKYANQVSKLQHKYPYLLAYVTRTSANLSLSAASDKRFSTHKLADFIAVAPVITELDVSGSAIDEQAISTVLNMINLEKINLKQTSVSANFIAQLLHLKHLKTVILPKISGIAHTVEQLEQAGVKVIQVPLLEIRK